LADGVLIVKNVAREGPGLLEDVMKERRIPYSLTDLDRGEDLPSVEGTKAVVVLGGPDSANSPTPKIKKELDLITRVLSAELPFLGICLGMQLLVKAAGGRVVRGPVAEVGFRGPNGDLFTVELTSQGRKDPIFRGLSRTLHVFQLHGESVELSDKLTLLARGRVIPNQVIKVAPFAYGFQCHFELTGDMLETWLRADEAFEDSDRDRIRSDFGLLEEEYAEVGRRLFGNFLDIANP